MKGKRLLGYSTGSSPNKPEECPPQGLKYLKEIILQSGWIFPKDPNNI